MVKRCGKSAPREAQATRHGKPHRVQGQIGNPGAARSRFRESETDSGYRLLRQMILSARKGADRIRLTALPKPLPFQSGGTGDASPLSGTSAKPSRPGNGAPASDPACFEMRALRAGSATGVPVLRRSGFRKVRGSYNSSLRGVRIQRFEFRCQSKPELLPPGRTGDSAVF